MIQSNFGLYYWIVSCVTKATWNSNPKQTDMGCVGFVWEHGEHFLKHMSNALPQTHVFRLHGCNLALKTKTQKTLKARLHMAQTLYIT